MKKYRHRFIFPLLFLQNGAFACITCNRDLQAAVYDSSVMPNLLAMLSAFFALTVLVFLLAAVFGRQYIKRSGANAVPAGQRRLFSSGMVLGIGLGGFIDGILLHQILQWHSMLSNRISVLSVTGKSVSMFWDGVFHLFCFCVVLVGLTMFWKVRKQTETRLSGSFFTGAVLIGWAAFNLVEGVINHHILQLHFVHQFSASPAVWNFAFLLFSLFTGVAGAALVMRSKAHFA